VTLGPHSIVGVDLAVFVAWLAVGCAVDNDIYLSELMLAQYSDLSASRNAKRRQNGRHQILQVMQE
jgi:hypothetical protein